MRQLSLSASGSSSAASSSRTAFTGARRCLTTSAPRRQDGDQADVAPSAPAYPFSSQVRAFPSVPAAGSEGHAPLQKVNNLKRGVLPYVHHQLRSHLDPAARLTSLFTRGSKQQIPIGSVLMVETWTNSSKYSTTTFSGVLLGVRRRGTSTSFVVRNLVLKLGVEMRFNLYSPLLKDVRVISRAEVGKNNKTGGLRRVRRAKLYYLRSRNSQVAGVSRMIKSRKKQDDLVAQKEAAALARGKSGKQLVP
ncbi:hypothetical protein BCV69DRAFT_248141 [Microstroma glucosiphilum]|uniref:Ribosomal protein L19 n=1 Tax=Pseudomicrostroma glucosiphilum TaxID=1684307 RepID=A0A316U8B1_9BASI|nr:hypothetical protein BCV69DRAFT_248141 [Pseudomicrostroma glucosiphilum]PWN21467.1 hypothetical protein BCV69DRAFT_248141 [Pseudomicrostroma glucosiphilum]